MLKTRQEDLITVDPEDVAVAQEWAKRRAAAAKSLADAQAELQGIRDLLSRDPAQAALRARTEAQAATRRASDDYTAAATLAASLHDAEQDAANEVNAAQVALDKATQDLSVQLAELMRVASSSVALTATVDGLALRQRFLAGAATDPPTWDHTTIPFLSERVDPELVFPAAGQGDYDALIGVLNRLSDAADAIADLITAESVHQLVAGNLVRSGAVLDLASGGHIPSSFDVVRTPQTGEAITHRVLLMCASGAAPMWPVQPGPGALVDPILSAWVTSMLPAPSTVALTVTLDGDQPIGVTADTLGLDPLGLVRAAADPGELLQRIALQARRRWGAAGRRPGRVEVAGLEDLVAAAGAVGDLLRHARALDAHDLVAPTSESPLVDPTVAAQRVTAAESTLTDLIARLDARGGGGAAGAPDPLGVAELLLAASAWGVAAATPALDQEVPPLAVLQGQATGAADELRARLGASPYQPDPDRPAVALRRARDRIQHLLGWQVPVLLPISRPPDPAWGPVFGAGSLADAEPADVRSWLDVYARVRPAVAALIDAYDLAEALGSRGGALDPVGAQLLAAVAERSRWHGADPDPPAGLVNLVVQRAFRGPAPASVAGLLVDSFTQRAPSRSQDTGVSFHVDEPDSTPPQAILVAVAPDLAAGQQPGRWDVELLCDTLLATLAMARQRAVAAENTTIRGITLPRTTT